MRSINYKNILISMTSIVMIAMISWFAICAEPLDVSFNSEDVYPVNGEFVVTNGDDTFVVNAPTQIDAEGGETIAITKILNEEDIKGNSLMFYVRQSFVNVYVGGELCIKDTSDREMPFYMTPGSYWHCFRLPNDWEGKELRIEIKADVERYVGEIPQLYTGNKNAFVYMTIEKGLYSVILCVAIFVFGMALVAFGVFSLNNVLRDRMVILGAFAIATSVWNSLEARMTQGLFMFSYRFFKGGM